MSTSHEEQKTNTTSCDTQKTMTEEKTKNECFSIKFLDNFVFDVYPNRSGNKHIEVTTINTTIHQTNTRHRKPTKNKKQCVFVHETNNNNMHTHIYM